MENKNIHLKIMSKHLAQIFIRSLVFFMDDGLIGEFAKEKIQAVIDFLNGKDKGTAWSTAAGTWRLECIRAAGTAGFVAQQPVCSADQPQSAGVCTAGWETWTLPCRRAAETAGHAAGSKWCWIDWCFSGRMCQQALLWNCSSAVANGKRHLWWLPATDHNMRCASL